MSELVELTYLQEELEEHMFDEAPMECVGLLLWNGDLVRLRNQADSPSRFFVNPQQLEDNMHILKSVPPLALYHSHPHREAIPSGEDERFMRYLVTVWPHVHHIILSPHGHRAYHVADNEIVERTLPWLIS